MLEGDMLQLGQFADDRRDIGEAVGTDHQFLEVFQLANFLRQRVEAVAEKVERLGVGVGFDFLHQAFGTAVGDTDFLLALRLGVAADEQQSGEKEDDGCFFHDGSF